jgi:tryptophanyl-tRNA synthetase
MSKSLNNAIYLSDDEATVKSKVMKMYTDPTRIHPTDPGHIEGNPVFTYLDAFATGKDKSKTEELKEKYKGGKVGDTQVKEFLVRILNEFLAPIRKKRAEYEKQQDFVEKILDEGSQKARKEAQTTLTQVKEAMDLS